VRRWPSRKDIAARDTGDVYMRRWRLVSTPWFGVFVHHILAPDWTRDLHDHPWGFVSVRLVGTYTEQLGHDPQALNFSVTEHAGRRVSVRPYGAVHRISRLGRAKGVWTLVLRGRRHQAWGFVTPAGWVHQAEYFGGERG
jgi:hypothetical protein